MNDHKSQYLQEESLYSLQIKAHGYVMKVDLGFIQQLLAPLMPIQSLDLLFVPRPHQRSQRHQSQVQALERLLLRSPKP